MRDVLVNSSRTRRGALTRNRVAFPDRESSKARFRQEATASEKLKIAQAGSMDTAPDCVVRHSIKNNSIELVGQPHATSQT